MEKKHEAILRMVRAIASVSTVHGKRNFAEFFTDRIVVACTEPTILEAIEKLAKSMGAKLTELHPSVLKNFMQNLKAGSDVLFWMRKYPSITGMLVAQKKEDFETMIQNIEIEESPIEGDGIAPGAKEYEIGITIHCISQFAHGGDNKAGNSTIFRRQSILTEVGTVLSLPFYSGNAFRGELRDILADHFLNSIGMIPRKDKPPVNLWFFHVLYAGGALEEGGQALNAIMGKLGKNGAVDSAGIHLFRDTLPHLSLLGAAMGNRIISGRINVGDFRPRCIEYGTGNVYASELFEWTFLTRKEDHEDHKEHSGMIANTECLKSGTILDGGIDPSRHISELEKSALACGIELLARKGSLGAENRRGLGQVKIDVTNVGDSKLYKEYLLSEKDNIINYLGEINAIPSD